jgi:uncharacterized protein involved in exopolysaccharide biosynthesis
MAQPIVSLWQLVWQYRTAVTLATLVGGACAAAASLLATPIYKAAVVLTETQDQDSSKRLIAADESISAENLGGVDLVARMTSDARMQQVLKSRLLAEEFVRRGGIAYDLLPDSKRPVSTWFAAKRFRERVVYVNEDPLEGTTTVSMEWLNPVVAATWANDFVALANEQIRLSDLQAAERRIAYLKAHADTTDDVALRRDLYAEAAEEMKAVMAANARSGYAFSVVDPAVAPELRTRPPRTLMTSMGAVTGLLVSLVIIFARYSFGQAPMLPMSADLTQ